MIGDIWEKERFLTRENEKDCLACNSKGERKMVPRNINEGPVRRKPVGHSCLPKIKYREKFI